MGWIVGPATGEGKVDGHGGEELTMKELKTQQKSVVGLPMFDNHNYKKLIGRIAGSFIDKGRLWIIGKVNEDTKHGKKAYKKIQTGEYGGLSVGTFGIRDEATENISDRMIAEASPCPGKEGRMPGTSIVLTMNSGEGSEHQVSMMMQDMGAVKPLGFTGDVPFDAPDDMIQQVVVKAQQFLQEQLMSSGAVPPTPTPRQDVREKEEERCKSCKRKIGDEDKKTTTTSSGSSDVETKEGVKSSILSGGQDNRKKTEQVNPTLTQGGSINTVEGTPSSSSTSEKTHKRPRAMEKTVHFDSPDVSGDKGKEVDESYKNDQLDLSGAVDAPLGGAPGIPFTGVSAGTTTPPTMTSLPKGPTSAGEGDESQFMQAPTQMPGDDKGKRKAPEQPRNDKGQFSKKAKADEGSSGEPDDINSLLDKISSGQSGGDGNKVTLSRDDLAGLFEKIKSAEGAQKERDEALVREREMRMQLESKNKSLEKQSKHSKISTLLKNAKASIMAAKELGEGSTDEDKSFWGGQADELSGLIQDEDSLYSMDDDTLKSMNNRTLVLSRASNSYNRKIAELQGESSAQMKKFESLLQKTSASSFDASSGRKRGVPEVSGGNKFDQLLKDMKTPAATPATEKSAPPPAGGGSSTTTSSSHNKTHASGSPFAVPAFAGASSIQPGLVPFKMSAVCHERDPNKGIFDEIERDLSSGGFFGFTNVDVPGITNRDWYDKPFRIPGHEAVGRASHMKLPPPAWALPRQGYGL